MRSSLPLSLLLAAALPAAAGELADQLGSPDRAVREAAAKTLASQGAGALGELQDALSKPSLSGRLAAVHLLSRVEGGDAVQSLAGMLAQEGAVGFAAACALADQGDARGESRLRDALAASQPLVRADAAKALASISSAAAVPDLVRALEDEDALVRAAAGEALCDITLQDFDFRPGEPSHDLPRDPEERQELEAILQWRDEQFGLLKEGKYTWKDAEGKERRPDPKRKEEAENRIKKDTVARWNEMRKRHEAKRREARAASVAQWRAWWEAHRSESPVDWLKAGLSHAKPSVRRRAAAKIAAGEARDLVPALVEALGREEDAAAAADEAKALASFRDKAAIEPLIAHLERMKDRKDVVAVVDLVLVDLTGVQGVPPIGSAWRAWWQRVGGFFEPGAVKFLGSGLEYALALKEGDASGCTLEVRRWLPVRDGGEAGRGAWLAKPFRVPAGEAVGQREVETKDRFQMDVRVDLLPGMVLERVEQDVRIVRRRPLKREGILRAVLRPEDPGWASRTPAEQDRLRMRLEIPAR